MKTAKQEILEILIENGNNKKDSEEMIEEHLEYVERVYPNVSNKKKAKIIRSL